MIIKANCIFNIVSKVMCWKTLTYSPMSMSRSWSGDRILSGSWSWSCLVGVQTYDSQI